MAQYANFDSPVLKTRIVTESELQPGDVIVGSVPPYGPLVPLPRPRYIRRVSSLDRDEFRAPYRGRGALARRDEEPDSQDEYYDSDDVIAYRSRVVKRHYRPDPRDRYDSEDPIAARSRIARRRPRPIPRDQDDGEDAIGFRPRGERRRARTDLQDAYDSEGSVPPRSRRPASERRGRGRQRSGDGDNADGSSSSASSSDLGCTDDDEKLKKKAKWKKWGAIGLAGVATIHAVHGVHETIEKTQKRHKELAEGKIDEGEAKHMKNKRRLKTAADVGVAGIWIKSAYDEIKEYREARHEHAEAVEKAEERHKKRLERAKSAKREQSKGRRDYDGYGRGRDSRDDGYD